jgi:hypothetical protein
MATFPILNTGSAIQFPVRVDRGPVRSHLKFWGGGSQSYLRRADCPTAWTLKYTGLTEDELARLLSFCDEQLSTSNRFTFEDPMAGAVHTSCSLEPSSVRAAATDTTGYEFSATIILEKE